MAVVDSEDEDLSDKSEEDEITVDKVREVCPMPVAAPVGQ